MTRRLLFVILAGAALMLAAFTAFFAVFQLPASAAPAGPPPAHWLVKSADLPDMAPASDFQWVACAGPGGLPCHAGQVRTFTRMQDFRTWVAAGHRGTVLYDPEGWAATPHYQYLHMWRYLRLFEQLATAHGIRVIAAPVRRTQDLTSLEATAARYGAMAVDVQLQWQTREPAVYAGSMRTAAAAIRAANPGTLVVAGIATDASGRPVTAETMVASYTGARPYVDGFWLNAAIWTVANGGTGCAVSGCRATGAAFLAAIG